MNDVDFPVARVLDGIDAAAEAGLPVKVNVVVKRGLNDDADPRDGRPLPRAGPHAALHRVHGRGRDERLADGRRRAGGRAHREDRRRVAARAGRAHVPRRGRPPLALPRRQRRDRRDRVGHPAVLRRLLAGAALGRGPPLHLPLRGSAATTCARAFAAAPPTRSCDALRAIWGRRADRYSELRTDETASVPKVEMCYIGG